MIVALVCHPDTPARTVSTVAVEIIALDGDAMRLGFRVTPADGLRLPGPAAPVRTDGLWQTSCFELFVATGAGGYLEFNLSPSSQWAAFAFDGYRTRMSAFSVAADPHVTLSRKRDTLMVEAQIDLTGTWPAPLTIGLSAVIEELDGTKSYWALRHPPGKPDFHHPDCFALQLP
jgi:hypothetical protein